MTELDAQELKEQLTAQLETVIDPELGIDIVNLGLVYEIDLNEEGHCHVQMTLTTIGCPLADVIVAGVKHALGQLDMVKDTTVEFVWYPAWTPERMSRYARIVLGIKV